MILLAKKIDNDNPVHFATMDIEVKHNAYGKQTGRFYTENEFKGIDVIPMTFIRLHYLSKVGPNIEVVSIVDGNIVAARYNNMLGTYFHPEVNEDIKVHKYFFKLCIKHSKRE